jgi:hypothetical protein
VTQRDRVGLDDEDVKVAILLGFPVRLHEAPALVYGTLAALL